MKVNFHNPPVFGNSIDNPSQELIENTLNLRQVDLETAARYGGSITRQALGAMNFHGDRKNIIVDTKVHMLLPGFIPAIPGWHTDGVPRGEELKPGGKGAPNLLAQVNADELGLKAPRYHLLVTGDHCPTRFLNAPFDLEIDENAGASLYKEMSRQVREEFDGKEDYYVDTPANTVAEWDWWSVHTAKSATSRGWRYLIRVTETDDIEPRTEPSDFIRVQNQVYVPTEFGW